MRLRFPRRRAPAGEAAAAALEREIGDLRPHGLVPQGRIEVGVGELQVQHHHEWRLDEVYPDGDLSLARSPFADLLERYRDQGRDEVRRTFRETPYYAMMRHFGEIGYYVDWATGRRVPWHLDDDGILARMDKAFRTYDSIARDGYLAGPYAERPIIVLREPYEVQCRGRDLQWRGYEVWSGHHRGAALAALGLQRAEVLLVGRG